MHFEDTHRLVDRKVQPLGVMAKVLRRLHLDGPLLTGLLLIIGFGLFVLYSAVGKNLDLWVGQCVRLGVALLAMFVVAQIPPSLLRRWAPWGYVLGLGLLVMVLTGRPSPST